MTYKYTITGMSCDGCRTKVEKTLNAMQGVQAVVTLNPPYYLDGKPIQTMHFQELLSAAGNYSIKVFNPNDALLPQKKSP
jgi:Cu2+-exporting ATPase